jgi:hypothetical protein
MQPDHPVFLDMTPEVVRALGAGSVIRLRADPTLDDYICCICDRPAHARTPDGASVVAIRYSDGVTVARLAHTDCSPSTLLTLLGGSTLRSHTVRARSALTASGHPVLQFLNDVRAWPCAGAREAADHHIRALRAGGFSPLRSWDDIATAPLASGLAVNLAGPSRVRIASPAGTLFDGAVKSSDQWRRAVRRRRRLTVIVCAPGTLRNPTLVAAARLARTRPAILRCFHRRAS